MLDSQRLYGILRELTETHHLESKMNEITTVVNFCPFCGTQGEVDVVTGDLKAWQQGVLIQRAMPYLSADERELVKTGICSKCSPS